MQYLLSVNLLKKGEIIGSVEEVIEALMPNILVEAINERKKHILKEAQSANIKDVSIQFNNITSLQDHGFIINKLNVIIERLSSILQKIKL